jgi:hypothetical protein
LYTAPPHTTNREEASSKQYQEVCVTWVNRQESKHVQTGGPLQYSTDKEGGSKYIPELSPAIIRYIYFKNACAYLGYNRVWLCLALNRDPTKMLQRKYIELPVDRLLIDKEYVNFVVWVYFKKLAFREIFQKWLVCISGNYSRVYNLSLSVHLRKNRVNISVRKPTSKMSEAATKSDSGGSGEYYWNVHVIIFTLSPDISVHCYIVLCCIAIINVVYVGYKKFSYRLKSICNPMPNASISLPYSVYCKYFLIMTSISKCSLRHGE